MNETPITEERLAEIRRQCERESWPYSAQLRMLGPYEVRELLSAYDALVAERDAVVAGMKRAFDEKHAEEIRAINAESVAKHADKRATTAERERDSIQAALITARGGLRCAVSRYLPEGASASSNIVRNALATANRALSALKPEQTT